MDGGSSAVASARISARRDGADDASALTFETEATGGSVTERMRIDNSGNVGIGTDNPSSNLHINEDSSNSYAILRLEGANRGGQIDMYNSTYPVSSIFTDQSGNIYFKTSGAFGSSTLSTKLTIATGGDVTLTNSLLMAGGGDSRIKFNNLRVLELSLIHI